jgi:hypothetical protein
MDGWEGRGTIRLFEKRVPGQSINAQRTMDANNGIGLMRERAENGNRWG